MPESKFPSLHTVIAESPEFNAMFLKKILYYLNPMNLFHRDENVGTSLRLMHGVNKISFLLFLICLAVMTVRWWMR
mgnify:CR=1 FL=1|jgi:hypothetical protein